jgi:hypothetical protein
MLDFRPDLDPRTPGYLAFVSELVPSPRGYLTAAAETAYTAHTYTLGAADEVWPNVLFASRWNSSPGGIVIVGTNKRLSVFNFTSGFINVSHAAGDYALGGTAYQFGEDAHGAFDLCAFGDVIIAANKSVTAQKRTALDLTAGIKFTDLGGATAAPAANTCCVAANFVFLGDVGNWSTVTGSSDILAWSAIGDHTDWRVNPQVTQSSYAQFVDTPGAITAVRPFRDGIIVFKANSMYRGRYVGAGPNSPIWDFERISDKIGCVGHRSVVNTENGLVFVGWRDVFIYDGTRPRGITHGIYDFMATQGLFLNQGDIPMQLGHNMSDNCVWLSTYTMTLVWNYRYDRWGMLSSQQTAQPISCQSNVDDFRTETVTSVSSGIPTVTQGADHFNLSTLRMIQGTPKQRNQVDPVPRHFFTTGWFGQPDKLQTIQRVNPVFIQRPVTAADATLTVYGSMTPCNPTALGTAKMNTSFRFDLLGPTPNGTIAGSTQNFFAFRYDLTNAATTTQVEIADLVPKFVPAGER